MCTSCDAGYEMASTTMTCVGVSRARNAGRGYNHYRKGFSMSYARTMQVSQWLGCAINERKLHVYEL